MAGPDVGAVRRVVLEAFPEYWPAVDLCLSTCATLLLAENVNPTAVILVGGPAAGKTTVASMFEGATVAGKDGTPKEIVYRSDNFSPASIVSQAANRKPSELDKVDLLPRIKDKVLLTPELAPMFRGKEDDLTHKFAVITRLLDGQGYVTDSGTHGHRGYTGRHVFAWIGCTTPFDRRVWRVMSQLGSRLFFLLMDTGRLVTVDDLLSADLGEKPYSSRVQDCRDAVCKFLHDLFEFHGGVASVSWRRDLDGASARLWLARCATLVAAMRTIPLEERENNATVYQIGSPESPVRARAVLTNVARGHALVHGRTAVTTADLPLIARVTSSSMPIEPSRILAALVANGPLAVREVQKVIGAQHPETARKQMAYMEAVGVVSFVEAGIGKAATLAFRPEWDWCASPQFRRLLAGEPVTDEDLCAEPEPITPEGVCSLPITQNLVQRQKEEGEGEEVGSAHNPARMTG
jgi:hypothetical protein